MKVCIAHQGIGMNPTGSGTRRSLANTRCTATGVKTASGIASRNDAPSAVETTKTISAAVGMNPSQSTADHVKQKQRRRQQDAQTRNNPGVGLLLVTAVLRDGSFGLLLVAAADYRTRPGRHKCRARFQRPSERRRDRSAARGSEADANRKKPRARRARQQMSPSCDQTAACQFRRSGLTCDLRFSLGPPTSAAHPSWPHPRS